MASRFNPLARIHFSLTVSIPVSVTVRIDGFNPLARIHFSLTQLQGDDPRRRAQRFQSPGEDSLLPDDCERPEGRCRLVEFQSPGEDSLLPDSHLYNRSPSHTRQTLAFSRISPTRTPPRCVLLVPVFANLTHPQSVQRLTFSLVPFLACRYYRGNRRRGQPLPSVRHREETSVPPLATRPSQLY